MDEIPDIELEDPQMVAKHVLDVPIPAGAIRKELLDQAKKKGLAPIDFLLWVQNNPNIDLSRRIDAAKSAAPFMHPKLSSIDISARMSVSHEDALKELE